MEKITIMSAYEKRQDLIKREEIEKIKRAEEEAERIERVNILVSDLLPIYKREIENANSSTIKILLTKSKLNNIKWNIEDLKDAIKLITDGLDSRGYKITNEFYEYSNSWYQRTEEIGYTKIVVPTFD